MGRRAISMRGWHTCRQCTATRDKQVRTAKHIAIILICAATCAGSSPLAAALKRALAKDDTNRRYGYVEFSLGYSGYLMESLKVSYI